MSLSILEIHIAGYYPTCVESDVNTLTIKLTAMSMDDLNAKKSISEAFFMTLHGGDVETSNPNQWWGLRNNEPSTCSDHYWHNHRARDS